MGFLKTETAQKNAWFFKGTRKMLHRANDRDHRLSVAGERSGHLFFIQGRCAVGHHEVRHQWGRQTDVATA